MHVMCYKCYARYKNNHKNTLNRFKLLLSPKNIFKNHLYLVILSICIKLIEILRQRFLSYLSFRYKKDYTTNKKLLEITIIIFLESKKIPVTSCKPLKMFSCFLGFD